MIGFNLTQRKSAMYPATGTWSLGLETAQLLQSQVVPKANLRVGCGVAKLAGFVAKCIHAA